MTFQEFLWSKLAEESAEIAQAALKIQRNGLRGKYATNLIEEMSDFVAATRLLAEEGLPSIVDEGRIHRKMGLWRENYRQMGQKHPEEGPPAVNQPILGEEPDDSTLLDMIRETVVGNHTIVEPVRDESAIPPLCDCKVGDYCPVQGKIPLGMAPRCTMDALAVKARESTPDGVLAQQKLPSTPTEVLDKAYGMGCMAYQASDGMYCDACELYWDVNDPYPPDCRLGS